EDDGSQDDHRPIVDGSFFVACRQATPLFEPVDAALHDVATRVDRLVEGQRTSRSCRSTGALIASFRNRMRDLALPQPLATARITVPLIGNDPVGTRSWPSPSAGAWHADAGDHGDHLRAVMPLSGRDDDGERPSLPIAR